jgi:hypothetical protein
MAALSSYTPIATYTVPSATTSYTFSSIPSTYTDLVIIINAQGASGADVGLQFNSDTGSNYSETGLDGNGSAASSFRRSNQTSMLLNNNATLLTANYSWVSIFSIQNYSNSTTYKSVLARCDNADNGVNAAVGLWRSTAAITSITVVATNSGFASGATFTLYGIANNTAGAKATGGVISSDSEYFYHSFYATSTFTPTQSLTCDYLVVAGGGGGAGSDTSGEGGGGGGAGGLRSTVTATGGGGSLETALSLTALAYTVTIGAGGAGGTSGSRDGTNGSNSVLSTITSTGGGAGGTNGGFTGGSGGGSSYPVFPAGSGTANQGFAGGLGGASRSGGGGGGGAGAVGSAASAPNGGAGGVGVETIISGTSTYYAGGGGGSAGTSGTGGAGGSGGGGAGKVGTGGTGTAGTIGTGGGAGAGSGSSGIGGLGGSGVVIIRYAR